MKQDLFDIDQAICLLATLADRTRLRVMRLLWRKELCVCELVDALRMPQYTVSRHLRQLRSVGLVEARREGRWMHYRCGQAAKTEFCGELLSILSRSLNRLPDAADDDARLAQRLRLRQSGECVVGGHAPCLTSRPPQIAARRLVPLGMGSQRKPSPAKRRVAG